MEHFSEQVWADFTLGLGARGAAESINAHLAAGCLKCKASHDLWGRIRKLGVAESSYTPPENLVRMAKLEFTAQQELQPEKWTLASLVFDSFSQPLPAGVRNRTATARQVVYEGEGLTVDLRFDRTVPSGAVSAVGQILDRRVPREPLMGASVIVWTTDGQLVATTEANRCGEFQVEFEPHDLLRLTARVGHRRIHIPLSNLK